MLVCRRVVEDHVTPMSAVPGTRPVAGLGSASLSTRPEKGSQLMRWLPEKQCWLSVTTF